MGTKLFNLCDFAECPLRAEAKRSIWLTQGVFVPEGYKEVKGFGILFLYYEELSLFFQVSS